MVCREEDEEVECEAEQKVYAIRQVGYKQLEPLKDGVPTVTISTIVLIQKALMFFPQRFLVYLTGIEA